MEQKGFDKLEVKTSVTTTDKVILHEEAGTNKTMTIADLNKGLDLSLIPTASAEEVNDFAWALIADSNGNIKKTTKANLASVVGELLDLPERELMEIAWGVPIKQDSQTSPEYGVLGNTGLWATYKSLCGDYLLTFNGKAAKLSATDRNYYADGTTVDVSKGDIMHYSPRLYFGLKDNILWMSLMPIPNGHYIEEQWAGVYNGSVDSNGRLRSIPNVKVTGNKTITAFWNAAQVNSTEHGLCSYAHTRKWMMMALSEKGNTNTQANFGYGPCGNGDTWSATNSLLTGATAELGDACGTIDISETAGNSLSSHVSFFGMENLWGWYWQMTQGITFYESTAIVYEGNRMPNASELAGTPTGNDRTFTRLTSSGQMLRIIAGEHFDIFPKALGGGSTSGWCDYSWANTTGQLFLFGGHASNGATCGLAAVHSNGDFGIVNGRFGARLAFYGKAEIVDGRSLA